jgi:hypothetical protein
VAKTIGHSRHQAVGEPAGSLAVEPVNPFAIGGTFLEYCVANGWLRREGAGRAAKYFLTESGRAELPKFGVRV